MARVQLVAIIGSVLYLFLIFPLVFKKRIREEYALLWLFFGFVLLVLSLWREALHFFSSLLGIYYPPTLLVLILIGAILLILVQYSVVISKLTSRISELTPELGLTKMELEKLKKRTKTGNKKMKISVVIPSYNQGKFIRQTIESILAQEGDIEVFVADGGSTDETVEILKSYGQKIQWVSEKDNGQTDAINKGLSRVTGDIVAYINSDDFYIPGAFKRVREVFSEHTEVMWLTGDALIVDEQGKEIQSWIRWYKKILRKLPFPWILYITNPIVQPSTFWRRELLKRVGFFRQEKHYTMDHDYWLRIIRYYQPHIVKEPLSAFRIHGLSKGGRHYEKQFREDWETVREHCNSPFFCFFMRSITA